MLSGSISAQGHRFDGRDGRGVGALSVSTIFKSCSVQNGVVRRSPAVGGLNLHLGVLTGRYILSRPAWQSRRTNVLQLGDATNQVEH